MDFFRVDLLATPGSENRLENWRIAMEPGNLCLNFMLYTCLIC